MEKSAKLANEEEVIPVKEMHIEEKEANKDEDISERKEEIPLKRKMEEESNKHKVKKQKCTKEEFQLALSKIPPVWAANIDRILFTESEIQKRILEMAAQISKDYAGESIVVVGLLKGAFVFLTDMIKHFKIPYEVDFMVVSSYGKGTTSGSIKLKKDLSIDPSGRHILILEDLIDTGKTLNWICNHLKSKHAKSIKIGVLLDKSYNRSKHVKVHYSGFDCENAFVVGLGMDFAEHYRGLPFVGVLKPEAYNNV